MQAFLFFKTFWRLALMYQALVAMKLKESNVGGSDLRGVRHKFGCGAAE